MGCPVFNDGNLRLSLPLGNALMQSLLPAPLLVRPMRKLVFMRLLPLRRRSRPKARYGVEPIATIRKLALTGAAALAIGVFVPPFYAGAYRISLIGPTLLAIGCLSLLFSLSLLAFALRGKFNIRDRMIAMIKWRGDEAVLDIRTGRGLVAIAAAKHLRTGTVTAIDNWPPGKESANTLEAVQRNIDIEGVHDRVELRSGDASDIAFVDNSFDAIFCLGGLDTVESPEARELAYGEIARVLKPRGTAIIAGFSTAESCAKALQAAGLKVDGPRSYANAAYTPLSIVKAWKR